MKTMSLILDSMSLQYLWKIQVEIYIIYVQCGKTATQEQCQV